MEHLTDEQIQVYLDNEINENSKDIELHLHSCEQCGLNFYTYRQIYSSLTIESELPALSNNFVNATISKLKNTKDKKWNLFENILITLMYVVGISLSVYILSLSNIISYFKKIDFSFMTDFSNKITGDISFNFIYLIAAVLIIFLIELLDRLKIQKSYKHVSH